MKTRIRSLKYAAPLLTASLAGYAFSRPTPVAHVENSEAGWSVGSNAPLRASLTKAADDSVILNITHDMSGETRAKHTIEVFDDIGNIVRPVGPPTDLVLPPRAREQTQRSEHNLSRLLAGLADGHYLVRVVVAAKGPAHEATVVPLAFFQVSGGTAVEMEGPAWAFASRNSKPRIIGGGTLVSGEEIRRQMEQQPPLPPVRQ